MRILILVAFLSIPLSADGPKWSYRETPKLDDEIINIYHDIRTAKTQSLPSFTLDELKVITPNRAGDVFYCSTCATDAVCVSTGTAAFAFSRLTSKTTQCQ